MRYSSRFFLYAPIALVLLLAAGVSLNWWQTAAALEARLDAVNGLAVMPGVRFAFASRQVAGFPFSLDIELRDVTLSVATPNGPTRWQTEKFALHALTYGRDETIFEAAGAQKLSWVEDGKTHSLPFAAGSLRASAILDDARLQRFDLDLFGFGSRAFIARRLQFHLRRNTGTLDYLLLVADLRAPGCSPFNARMEGSLTEAQALAPLLAGKTDWQTALAAWRGAQGRTSGPLAALPAEDLAGGRGLRGVISPSCRGRNPPPRYPGPRR
jgi:hypothetical protein